MVCRWSSHNLQFKFPFSIAGSTRTETEGLYIILKDKNLIGYGEAVFPPYLNQTRKDALHFLETLNVRSFDIENNFFEALNQISLISNSLSSLKAALDMALWDLYGKFKNKTVRELWQAPTDNICPASFTIGIGSNAETEQKLLESESFHLIKVKLNGINDKKIIDNIRQYTAKPICVDANQSWININQAIEMANWLFQNNCILIEQPFNKLDTKNSAILKSYSPIPIIADESFQNQNDINKVSDSFDGINIKLYKCGGLTNAKLIIEQAIKLDLKILIGCMSESSCACSAAAQLLPWATWADIDGPLLITNDPFNGLKYINGKVVLNNSAGIGVVPKSEDVIK